MTRTKETARTTLFTSKGPKHISDYSLFVLASLTDFRLMTFHHNGFWKVKPVFRQWLLFWIFVSFKNTLNTPWEVLFQHFSFSQKHTHPLIQYKISSYHISHGTNWNCAPCLDGREMLCLCVYTVTGTRRWQLLWLLRLWWACAPFSHISKASHLYVVVQVFSCAFILSLNAVWVHCWAPETLPGSITWHPTFNALHPSSTTSAY